MLMRYGLEQEDGDHCQAESAAEWKRRVRELNGNEWKRRVRELNGNEWKRRVRELNGNEWKEEVWYKAVKDVLGVEKYVASWEGHEAIRLRFRQRTGSAGLLEDKRRCRLCVDERCVLYV